MHRATFYERYTLYSCTYGTESIGCQLGGRPGYSAPVALFRPCPFLCKEALHPLPDFRCALKRAKAQSFYSWAHTASSPFESECYTQYHSTESRGREAHEFVCL